MGLFDGVKAAVHKMGQSNPKAATAGEEDHSDPDVFRGEDAEAPVNPEVENN